MPTSRLLFGEMIKSLKPSWLVGSALLVIPLEAIDLQKGRWRRDAKDGALPLWLSSLQLAGSSTVKGQRSRQLDLMHTVPSLRNSLPWLVF